MATEHHHPVTPASPALTVLMLSLGRLVLGRLVLGRLVGPVTRPSRRRPAG